MGDVVFLLDNETILREGEGEGGSSGFVLERMDFDKQQETRLYQQLE